MKKDRSLCTISALRVSASSRSTVHTNFHHVLSIEIEINKLFEEPKMATRSETEKVLTEMTANMNAKFEKYYGGFKDLNPLVFMGLLLDSKFKLRHITHRLRKKKSLQKG